MLYWTNNHHNIYALCQVPEEKEKDFPEEISTLLTVLVGVSDELKQVLEDMDIHHKISTCYLSKIKASVFRMVVSVRNQESYLEDS